MIKFISILYGILSMSLFAFFIQASPNYIHAITPALNGTDQDDFLVRVQM